MDWLMSFGQRRSNRKHEKLNPHSLTLPGSERIHQSLLVKPNDLLETPPDEDVTTIFDLLQRAVKLTNNGKFIGERAADGSIEWISYEKAIEDAKSIGSALLHFGLEAGESTRVGIAGLNSSRYMITQYALLSYSIVAVPLYYNYKFDALCEIINNCDLEVIFCDTLGRAESFIKCANDGMLTSLKRIIIMDRNVHFHDVPHQDCQQIKLCDWEYMLEIGRTHLQETIPPQPSSIYIICHTSGTTGTPKGVQLSHCALLASMAGLYVQWCVPPNAMTFNNDDIHLSFLSLAHVYEQLLELFMIYVGGRVAVFGGDVSKLINDMLFFRPTVVALVPRILSRFHDRIMQQMDEQNLLKRLLFQIAFKVKSRMFSRGTLRFDTVWDKFVFKKIHAQLGGKLRLLTTGGAPTSKELIRFSRIVYGCPIFEGYGQTECCAAGTITLPYDIEGGHVGGPAPWAQVKLVDVEELSYSASKNAGEVCFRGAALMSGYFKDDELTAKVIDDEGWLHTGDIGEWLSDGSLRIIDRKSNFLKLSQGDFVSPEEVEKIYSQHPAIKQIFVYGSSIHSYLVAIIVVDVALLRKYHTATPVQHVKESAEPICLLDDRSVRERFLLDLREFGVNRGLTGIEQIRNAHLTEEEFTADSGLLTPTLKVKRSLLISRYAKIFEKLYAEELY